jgi:antitoxin FitA
MTMYLPNPDVQPTGSEVTEFVDVPLRPTPPATPAAPSSNEKELDTARAHGAITHALAPYWRYLATVPSIQVKDVPQDVHLTLRRRAAVAGQSLQEYLLNRLIDDAHTPTLDELLDRVSDRAGGRAGFKAAVEAVRADRDTR